MSTTLTNRRKVAGQWIWDEYQVHYNAAPFSWSGMAFGERPVLVRFGSRDKWVGRDYWHFIGTHIETARARSVCLLERLEKSGRAGHWLARVARQVAYKERGWI